MSEVDLRLLAPFVALAEELHFGQAATRLHIAQPALTQQIKRLERQLGVTLFERHTRVVRLAPAGRAFLAGARAALQLIELAGQDARRAGQPRRDMRIGVDVNTPDGLAKQVRRFGVTRPDLAVRVSVQQQDDLLRELADGRLQLLIGWTGPPADEHGVAWTPLVEVELHGAIARQDPIAADRSLRRSALAEHRLVMYEPTRETLPFYEFFRACFTRPDGTAPSVVHIHVFDEQEAMLDMVESGGGFTLCQPGELRNGARQSLVDLPFEPPLYAQLVMMWRRFQEPDTLGDLLAFLRDTAPWQRGRPNAEPVPARSSEPPVLVHARIAERRIGWPPTSRTRRI